MYIIYPKDKNDGYVAPPLGKALNCAKGKSS